MANPASDANGMTVHRFVCSANGQPSVRHDRCRVSPRGKHNENRIAIHGRDGRRGTDCMQFSSKTRRIDFLPAGVCHAPAVHDPGLPGSRHRNGRSTDGHVFGHCRHPLPRPQYWSTAASATITWTITDGYVFSTEPFKYAIIIKSDPLQAVQECKRADERQAPRDPIRPHYLRTLIWVWSELPAGSNGDFCDMLDPYMID